MKRATIIWSCRTTASRSSRWSTPASSGFRRRPAFRLVATNDAHYLRRQDASMPRCFAVHPDGQSSLRTKTGMRFSGQEFYRQVGRRNGRSFFPIAPEALENTVRNCGKMPAGLRFFSATTCPVFPLAGRAGRADRAARKMSCRHGAALRLSRRPRFGERLEYEISMIAQMGFVDYFLIVGDFIKLRPQNGNPGRPGTRLGSRQHGGLLPGHHPASTPSNTRCYFERFLNPERVSMPDIDIDFCYMRRQEVIDYVMQKYGESTMSRRLSPLEPWRRAPRSAMSGGC